MKTIENVYDYGVLVKGFFGRNRNFKREYFTLLNDQLKELTHEELENKLKEFTQKIKLKKGTATIKVYKVQNSIETFDGVTFKSKMLNPMEFKILNEITV